MLIPCVLKCRKAKVLVFWMMDSCLKERFTVSGKAWEGKSREFLFQSRRQSEHEHPHLADIQAHSCDSISLILTQSCLLLYF